MVCFQDNPTGIYGKILPDGMIENKNGSPRLLLHGLRKIT